MSDNRQASANSGKLKSPDSLNDCIRVAGPGVWLVLAAVILILAGACVWGIFGHIDTTVAATATVTDNMASFYVSDAAAGQIPETVIAKVGGYEYAFARSGEPSLSGPVCVGSAETSLPDGEYPAEVVLEREKPISFIFN